MTPDSPIRLRMFAGPNGSGKTSLVRMLARECSPDGLFQLHRYINADDILRDLQTGKEIAIGWPGQTVVIDDVRRALSQGGRLRPNHPFLNVIKVEGDRLSADPSVCDDYVGAALADYMRESLLDSRASFSFETVMSHSSKVNFFARARSLGYRTYLYFVATESPEINVAHVQNRAALGGHDVPSDKVKLRYERCLALLGDALNDAYRAFVFDNSGRVPIWLAEQTPEKSLTLKVSRDALPDWFRKWVPGQ